MKKNVLLAMGFFSVTLLSNHVTGQVLARSSLSSIGGSSTLENAYFSHTLGQGIPTISVQEGTLFLRQGFEQAQWKKMPTLTNEVSIYIYPNPSNGEFSIALSGTDQSAVLNVYDYAGKLVARFDVLANSVASFSLNQLASGMYRIEVMGNTFREQTSLLITK